MEGEANNGNCWTTYSTANIKANLPSYGYFRESFVFEKSPHDHRIVDSHYTFNTNNIFCFISLKCICYVFNYFKLYICTFSIFHLFCFFF